MLLPARIGDFVWTWMSECLVQDSVVNLFEQHHVTGYALDDVEASFERTAKRSIPRLRELLVRGWGGVAPAASGVKLLESQSCRECRHWVYSTFSDASKLVDPSAWDGDDVFMVWPLPRFIFVTNRVAELIRSNELTGASLLPVSSLKTQGETLTPGNLSDWMPPDRLATICCALQ